MTHGLQVQVDVGTGMGKPKSTHGLPVQKPVVPFSFTILILPSNSAFHLFFFC
jgi:hypothetical protein